MVAVACLHLGCSQPESAPPEANESDEAEIDGSKLVLLGRPPRAHVSPPFTGTALWKYKNGKRRIARTFVNGIRQGPMVVWFDDGTTQAYTVNYKNDRMDGQAIGFYPDGKKRFERFYKLGRHIETWTSWHTNGTKSLEYKWVQGHTVVTNAWNAGGKSIPPPKPRIRRPLRQPNRRPPVKGKDGTTKSPPVGSKPKPKPEPESETKKKK